MRIGRESRLRGHDVQQIFNLAEAARMSKTGRWRPARTGRMWAAPTARARALSLSARWTGGRCGQVARCGKVDRWQRLTPPCACHKLAPDPAPASGEATSERGAESLGAQQQPGQPRAAAAPSRRSAESRGKSKHASVRRACGSVFARVACGHRYQDGRLAAGSAAGKERRAAHLVRCVSHLTVRQALR